MRILYVTNGFPYPLTSGYLRHYFLIRQLARAHQITLLSLVRPDFADEHREAMRSFTEELFTFPVMAKNGSLVGNTLTQARTLLGREPAMREMCATMARLTGRSTYDLVLLSGRQTYPVLECLGGLPVVVDVCDAAAARLRGTLPYVRPSRKPLAWVSYQRMKQIETHLIRGADQLLFISPRDRDAALGGSARDCTIVPNGIDTEAWARSTPTRGQQEIVFTGGMNYPPNTDAALLLIERILPLVRREVPGVHLSIVGRDPPARLIKAGRRAGAEVTGFVDDVRPYLERATLLAAPIRFGAGMQNKVLEAMSMGLPVITSAVVADGLRPEAGQAAPVEIAETPQDFAGRIVRQLIDSQADPSPDTMAREFVEEHFCWGQSGEILEEVIHQVCGCEAHAVARG